MAKKDKQNLTPNETDAVVQAQMDALKEQDAREIANVAEQNTLATAQAEEQGALESYNQTQYNNLDQIVGDIQGRIDAAKQKDEAATKRENAFRYISGVGDTISSLANLVGTAHGAANQKQAYNSHAVVQKAEAERKARKLEMEDLNNRITEMRARQRDLKAAGSLKEAELKAKHNRESLELASKQRKADEEAKKYADAQAYRAAKDARDAYEKDRVFEFNKQNAEQTRAHQKAMNDADNAAAAQRYAASGAAKAEEFNLGNGEFVSVPKDRMNEYNITELFDMVPQHLKESAGRPKIDSYGDIVGYYPPTQKEMLSAINRAAQTDPAIKDAIRNLGSESTQPVAEEKTTETPAPQTANKKKKPNPMA